ncbi:MAG: DUF3786 domain-containing protein [Phycisphaerales bacterium]|nr:MAG: DUF3786 domain-containing protein [Phycisphaerales bacterium]
MYNSKGTSALGRESSVETQESDRAMAHTGLWRQLEKLNGAGTARRAKCQYLTGPERYVVPLLNMEYVVSLSERSILPASTDSSQRPAGFLEQLCLLAYLINAQELPLAGKLCKAETLPGGQFFFRGPHSLGTEKLQTIFGDSPEALYKACPPLGAEQCEFGDASIRLSVLPRLPLTVVIWARCEEFEARASILFDKSAADQLPLDALMAAANVASTAIVGAATPNE